MSVLLPASEGVRNIRSGGKSLTHLALVAFAYTPSRIKHKQKGI